MAVSQSPWWWAPEWRPGGVETQPDQMVVAPLVCSETPASRVMPVVWAVLQSRSVGRTTLIPAMADLSRSRRSAPAYRRAEARTRTPEWAACRPDYMQGIFSTPAPGSPGRATLRVL